MLILIVMKTEFVDIFKFKFICSILTDKILISIYSSIDKIKIIFSMVLERATRVMIIIELNLMFIASQGLSFRGDEHMFI